MDSARRIEAARWVLWGDDRAPIVQQVKSKFELTALEACEVIKKASLIKARAT
ncbi:hypothetical protein GB928_018630 [Shinella curvata]|uniref:Uncharacterized protein n=1 Tax=Shinella curvata TaxID=1817964 RepID=A0ABT8XHK0_9HYPH|nr:hypothetical protein [Shinella curvata]MCJ8053876.1 hypothetical protein [Shinella curvata]MDO6123208.1 hypothetical protein [Shinella curvata]